MAHRMNWPEERIVRFVKLWNDGIDVGALKVRFECKNPWAMAAHLRKRGYALLSRKPKGGA